MKKILFLCFSVLFTNFIYSQVTVNAPSSVEVGVNNNFGFTFLPKSSEYPSGSTSYKLTSWFINDGSSNMNNSGFGSYSNNSQSLNTYSIGQSQNLNFPIKWEDNSNSLTSSISIVANVSYYAVDTNGNTYLAGSRIHSSTYAVNINRIFTPTISSPTILSCCSNTVTFSASNFGTANVFNWSISGGSFTGSGSSITVTPSAGNGSVFASCTVSRSAGLSTYNRSNSRTISRTARTATFETNPFGQNFVCKSGGSIFETDNQCGISSVIWNAPNCTVSTETIVNGKRQVTITPNVSVTGGTSISIYATANFIGGCVATTPSKSYFIFDNSTPIIPSGTLGGNNTPSGVTNPAFHTFKFTPSPATSWKIDISPISVSREVATFTQEVNVCYTNPCTGSYTCKTFYKIVPGRGKPCASCPPLQWRIGSQTNVISELKIYPNPTTDNIKVNLPEATSGNYQLFDQNSKLLLESNFEKQSELTLDFSMFNSGIYILKISTESDTFTEKIILNK